MRHFHLSDNRLIEICFDGADAGAREHLDVCAACETRRREFAALLQDCSTAATVETDSAFSEERLARQRARILQRVELDGRPARVISFPGVAADATERTATAHMPARPGTARRWIAGAAAAGLVIGLLAGEFVNGFRSRRFAPATQAQAVRPAPAAPLSDEDLLRRVDAVVERAGSAGLSPLDELTPRVWEVSATTP